MVRLFFSNNKKSVNLLKVYFEVLLYFLLIFSRKGARSVISSFLTNQVAKGENNPGTTMFLQYQHAIDIYGSRPRDMNKHFVLKGDYDILA